MNTRMAFISGMLTWYRWGLFMSTAYISWWYLRAVLIRRHLNNTIEHLRVQMHLREHTWLSFSCKSAFSSLLTRTGLLPFLDSCLFPSSSLISANLRSWIFLPRSSSSAILSSSVQFLTCLTPLSELRMLTSIRPS